MEETLYYIIECRKLNQIINSNKHNLQLIMIEHYKKSYFINISEYIKLIHHDLNYIELGYGIYMFYLSNMTISFTYNIWDNKWSTNYE